MEERIKTDLYEEETNLLTEYFKIKRPRIYLELGVLQGVTMKKMVDISDKMSLDTTFYGIDCFDRFLLPQHSTHTGQIVGFAGIKKRFNHYKNVHLVASYTLDFLIKSYKSGKIFDFIFHDADHNFNSVLADLIASLPVLSSGGFVAVHNTSKTEEPDKFYYERDGGPRKAVDMLVKYKAYKTVKEKRRLTILRKLP